MASALSYAPPLLNFALATRIFGKITASTYLAAGLSTLDSCHHSPRFDSSQVELNPTEWDDGAEGFLEEAQLVVVGPSVKTTPTHP